MLSNLGLNKSLWAEAISITCYLVNPSTSTVIDFKNPIEVRSNKPVEYSMLKVFGCLTYYHVSEGKQEPRAKKGFFMDNRWSQRISSLVSILKKGHSE